MCSGFSVILPSGCNLFQVIGQSMPTLLHFVQGTASPVLIYLMVERCYVPFCHEYPSLLKSHAINHVRKLKKFSVKFKSCWFELEGGGECKDFSIWPCWIPVQVVGTEKCKMVGIFRPEMINTCTGSKPVLRVLHQPVSADRSGGPGR